MTPEERSAKLREVAYRVETASQELLSLADSTLYDLNATIRYLEEAVEELKTIP
jgi:hypothetical protein